MAALKFSCLYTILSFLLRLGTLKLRDNIWDDDFTTITSLRPVSLDTLELTDQSDSEVLNMLSLFAHVDKLVLDGIQWLAEDDELDAAYRIPPHFRMRDLTVKFVKESIMKVIGRWPCMESIEALRCLPFYVYHEYLGLSGPWQDRFGVAGRGTLTHLELGLFIDAEGDSTKWFPHDFSQCVQLKHIKLRVFHDCYDESDGDRIQDSFTYVTRLLSTLPPSTQQTTIVLEPAVVLPDIKTPQAGAVLWGTVQGWRGVDQMLPELENLTQVTIALDNDQMSVRRAPPLDSAFLSAFKDIVRMLLPRMCKKGMVSVGIERPSIIWV